MRCCMHNPCRCHHLPREQDYRFREQQQAPEPTNTVTIYRGSYRWVATLQADKESFLVQEYSGSLLPFNTYAINKRGLDQEISRVMESTP